jgi:hypothetical protein
MLTAAEPFLNLRRILDDPPIERGMIHRYTPLAHHLFELAVTDRVRHVPSNSPQNDFSLELTALEVKHAAPSTALCGVEHSQKSLR